MRFVSSILLALTLTTAPAFGQTRDEWIALGTRIHGGYGVLIPIGIRIGLDAKEKLKAEPRGLSVVFHMGMKAPCPCIADGIMIATQASPGQGTLMVAAERAPEGVYAAIIVRDRKTGAGIRYTISDRWIPKIVEWNRTLDPAGRHDAAIAAEGLFRSETLTK